MLFLALVAHMQVASPDSAYWERIAAVMGHKNYRLAELLIRQAPLKDEEDKLRQQTLLARALLLEKRYDDAEPLLVKLLDKDPALADRHLFELAQVRLGRGDFAGALNTAEGVDGEGLYASEAEVVRVSALSGLGRIDDAVKRCTDSAPEAKKSEWRLACGRVFLLAKKTDDGEAMLREIIRRDFLNPIALVAEQTLIATLPAYKEMAASDMAYGRGEQFLKRRRLDAARGYFKSALDHAKDAQGRAEPAFRLADIDERKQNFTQALASYLRAADLGEKSAVSEQSLFAAGTLATRLKNLSLAQSIFQRLLLENPLADGRQQALFGLGFTAFLAHDYPSSNQFLRTLMAQPFAGAGGSARTDKQRARYWLGRSEEALEHPAQAQLSYSEILRDDPAGYYAVRAQERLEDLHMAALDLPFEQAPKTSFKSSMVAAVERVIALAHRAFRTEAVHFLDKLAHGTIPNEEDAVALRDGFLAVGEIVKADVVLAVWRYDHLGELPESERQETLRMRHPRLFSDVVGREAAREGLTPADVFAIVRQESRFLPRAKSPCGARGLMQLMWGTAQQVGRELRIAIGAPDNLYRPDVNVRLGTHYLSWLMRRYDHKELSVAAYNAGPGNIDKWQKLFGDLPIDVFCELIPFAETRDYVQRVLGYSRGYAMTGQQTASR